MRGLMWCCLLIVLLFAIKFTAAQDSAFPRPFCIPPNFVTTTRAFLREEPSSQSQPAGVVPAGAQVIKLRQVQGESLTIGGVISDLWYLVNYRDEYANVSEGYIWSLLLEVAGDSAATPILLPQFTSTVVDNNENVYELSSLRTETPAALDTGTPRGPLRHQLLALRRTDSITQLVWLPLIQRLQRIDDVTVAATLFSGETLSGAWVRSLPVKYPTESLSDFILGEPTDGPSRRTVSLPDDSVQSIENDAAPAQRAAFQATVNCYLATFEDTARPVEITLQTSQAIAGIFGYLIDGGGAYARYTWKAHRDLMLWPGGAERCESRLNGYPVANEISFADIAALTLTENFGDCGGRVVRALRRDGAVSEGALISRDESYSGNWLYGANLGDDHVIVFTPYGAEMIPLSVIAGMTFSD